DTAAGMATVTHTTAAVVRADGTVTASLACRARRPLRRARHRRRRPMPRRPPHPSRIERMPVAALLVDDDARLPALLKSFLEPQGVDVTTATSGAAALETLERDTFDVVILDVMMPGMDGLETLRRIRVMSSVPVLMLTARGDETDR